MKTNPKILWSLVAAASTLLVATAIVQWPGGGKVVAQDAAKPAAPKPATPAPVPAAATVAAPNPTPASQSPAPTPPAPGLAAPPPGGPPPPPPGPGALAPAAPGQPAPDAPGSTNDVQVSFQGANIEMVVQWLAKTTGKSVIKHPRVQCQLTIVSSKGLSARDALNLVYRALSLEGFSTVETSNSILIVPEGQEPKTSLELMDASQNKIPEGRQKLVKIFQLRYIQAPDLRDKIRAVVSDKTAIELNERSNQIIVTDYTETVRLVGELIKELDIASPTDSTVELYPLKFSEADEMATLISAVLNAQALPPSASAGGGAGRSSSRGMPPGVMIMGDAGPPPSPGGGGAPAGGGTGQIKIWPDKTANRLIVAAPKAKQADIERMINLLDTEKPKDVSVRTIALKNVSAEDLVREIAPLYQKMSGKSVKDTMEVTANSRSNSLIVLSSEANFRALQKLIESLDTEDAQEKAMRAFPLKNADAEDVAKQLKDLASDSQSTPRYFYFYGDSDNRKNKKMSVVADRRRNTVIVQAPPGSLDGIAKMIEELDEPVTDNSLSPKIIPLKYVSAVDIEDVLNELFLKKQQQRSYWDYVYESDFGGSSSSSKDKDAGRLFGKVRITSEPYSNSIIVTSNSPENLGAVEEVIKQLDRPSEAGDSTLRVELKFAQAVHLASSMNILFAKGGSPPLRQNQAQPNQPQNQNGQQNTSSALAGFELERDSKEDSYYPWLGGQQENTRGGADGRTARPVSDLVGRVRVVPDRRSNSLLVTSNVHFFPQVLKLIAELDAPSAQVLIEAKIIEVSTDFRDKLGVRWSPDGNQVFDTDDLDNSIKIKGSGAVKNVFAGTPLTADAFRSGVVESKVDLDILVQFLRRNTDATVLAEPQINISDNELGKLFVGSQVPILKNSLTTDVGGRNDSYDYKDVGIILEVTPHINNAEEVALKIRAESSSIRAGQTILGGAIFDTRNFKTDLLLKNGQTLVLGGIIQREDQNTMRKTPILGDIPGLGWAFKKKDKVSREVELMVFLRPRITRSPQDAKNLLDEIDKRTPHLKAWKEEQENPKPEGKKKK